MWLVTSRQTLGAAIKVPESIPPLHYREIVAEKKRGSNIYFHDLEKRDPTYLTLYQ